MVFDLCNSESTNFPRNQLPKQYINIMMLDEILIKYYNQQELQKSKTVRGTLIAASGWAMNLISKTLISHQRQQIDNQGKNDPTGDISRHNSKNPRFWMVQIKTVPKTGLSKKCINDLPLEKEKILKIFENSLMARRTPSKKNLSER